MLSKVSNRPVFWVIFSAICLILSFPPFPLAILAYVAFVPLLWWVEQKKSIFVYAYWLFFIWNWGCGYWLGFTGFGVEDDEKIMAFATGILANTINPLLMALPLMGYARFRRFILTTSFGENFKLVLSCTAFISFWILFEFLHYHWDLSWSWYTLGNSLSYYVPYIQYYEFTGVLGGSLHILLINFLIFSLLRKKTIEDFYHKPYLYGVIGGLILPLFVGFLLLAPYRSVFQSKDSLNVRIIQPNIDPFSKYEELTPKAQIDIFQNLAMRSGIDSIDMILLPETAIPKYVWRDKIADTTQSKLFKPLWDIAYKEHLTILTGIVEARSYPASLTKPTVTARQYQQGYYDMYNAATVLAPYMPTQTFEKGIFVPFVERVPFVDQLPFLKDFLVEMSGGYGGYGKPDFIHPMQINKNAVVGTMICYESVFGDYIRKLTLGGANFLAILTNDGWWRKTSGHLQHAQFTTLRAIENRRDIARSANTGISLFADSKGYLHNKTPYWERLSIDGKIHLYKEITFYVRYGDYLGFLAWILTIGLCFWVAYHKYQLSVKQLSAR